VENLVLLRHCDTSTLQLPGHSWNSLASSHLEWVQEMVRVLVSERARSKPYAYPSEAGIQVHMTRT
jgi:hypothetical protein